MNWLSTQWDNFKTHLAVLGALFSADVWPYIKSTVLFFLTDEGKVILQAAIAAAPTLATNFSAAVSEVVQASVAAAPGIISQDATHTLNQIQTALQLVKNTQGMVAPNDTGSLDAVKAAQSAAGAPETPTPDAAAPEADAQPVADPVPSEDAQPSA